MMKLTKTVLSVFLAMAFAAGSLNVSATESDVELDKQAKTPTAAERMKFRTIENLVRSHRASSRAFSR